MNNKIDLEKTVYKTFSKKYKFKPTQFYISVANYFIFNGKCHLVSLFKENLLTHDKNEFLKRYYTKNESFIRIKKYIHFYETYKFTYPNYIPIPESKFMYHNLYKKQRVLDEQIKIKKKRLEKFKKISTSKNNKPIFDNSAYDSILQPSLNLYNSIFGTNDNKDEDSIEEINKLIENFSNINDSHKNDLIKLKQQKNFPICIRLYYPSNKMKKKPDSSPINILKTNLSSTSKNLMKTLSFNNKHSKSKNFATFINNKNNIKNELENSEVINNLKKNCINCNKKENIGIFSNRLIYRKINPIDKARKINHFSVNSRNTKNKLTIMKTDSESSFKCNKIMNTKSNFYIKKINTMKRNETWRENYNKNKLPIRNQLGNRKLSEILKIFNSKNLIYQRYNSENKSDRKIDNRSISKKLISTCNQLCQSLSNNNGKKNTLINELELYNMKNKKRKITPIRINLHYFDVKNGITSTMKTKTTFSTEESLKHKKIISNNINNFNNKQIYINSYLKNNFSSYSCSRQNSIKRIDSNFNSPPKNLNLIVPNKNNKLFQSDKYMTQIIQKKTDQVYYNKGLGMEIKQFTIQNINSAEKLKKIKQINHVNTNNNNLFFRKYLIGRNDLNSKQNKLNHRKKNCLSINNSKEKRNNNDLNDHTYSETKYQSLNNFYKCVIRNNKTNKNTINFINNNIINLKSNDDFNKKNLKTEVSKNSVNLTVKGKKKIIIIKKNHKNSNNDSSKNLSNSNNKNNNNKDNQSSQRIYFYKTERNGNGNTIKNIKIIKNKY